MLGCKRLKGEREISGRECFKNYDKDRRLVVTFMSAMLLIGLSLQS